MHNPTGKTKTAMLLELESIKGLLIEEEDIPILQEVVASEIPVLDEPVLDVPVLDVPVLDVPVLDVPVLNVTTFDVPVLDVPVLDEIVPPEDLPDEAIPLLVSVVVDDHVIDDLIVDARVSSDLIADQDHFSAAPTQFATDDDSLSWPESYLDTAISLDTEINPNTNIETELSSPAETHLATEIHPDNEELPAAEPLQTLESAQDLGELSPLSIATQPEPTTSFTIASESQTNEPVLLSDEIPTLTASEENFSSADIVTASAAEVTLIENINAEKNQEVAASLQAETPQHRSEQQQDLFQTGEENSIEPEPAANSLPPTSPASTQRPITVKTAGENPFLPEHIRARLQANNNQRAEQTGDIHSKRLKGLALGSLHSPSPTANKPSPIQQQLINEVMDKMLPEMARELRGRLEKMSKQMLEELLAER